MPTYREAGVDVAEGEALVEAIGPAVTKTWGPDVVGAFGGFAAGVRIPPGFLRPILMMTTDGVGTKIEVARRAGRLEGIGFDLVAMCVDDLATVGARPIAFTDYMAVGKLDRVRDEAIVASIAGACSAAGCALLGGETAEHPGVVAEHHIDLAGAALGVVEDGHQVTGETIRPGDAIIGVHSPNLRSNGYSLVRAVLDLTELDSTCPGTGVSWGEALADPSVIYSPAILDAVATGDVHGLAHITGGGLAANVRRILPGGVDAVIDSGTWKPPSVFSAVAERGKVSRAEMFRTFNMGIGFVVVSNADAVEEITDLLAFHGHSSAHIGGITAGNGQVTVQGIT